MSARLEVGKLYKFPFSPEEVHESIGTGKYSYKVFYEETENEPVRAGLRPFHPDQKDSNILLFLEKRRASKEGYKPIWEFRFLYGKVILTSDYIPDCDVEIFEQRFKQLAKI